MTMGNLSILKESLPEEGSGEAEEVEEILEDITMEEMSLGETLNELMSGGVVLMTTYDNQRSKDTLVRIRETNNGMVTQVSKPTTSMTGFMGGRRYWTMYDITINSLSLYPTYKFDPIRYDIGYVYEPMSIVKFTTPEGEVDVAMVEKVLRDKDSNFYYTLSGEGDTVFKEEELELLERG